MPLASRSLKQLFLEALAVAPAERAAWLSRECVHDAALRQQVELMLAAHDAPQSLLDRLAPVGPVTEVHSGAMISAGTTIGPYKLLQQIGEGGMGVVYMAEQTVPVGRRVALKVIKPGMDTRQVIARFEAERQALAMMDHPNIAKVFDAGTTESGSPYFVMELVRGIPITRYCDEHHFTLKQRLELFLPVCQAVQHAHQKGIIHRDLKPTNVLVAQYDDNPVPKVIDFGVAKAAQKLTDRTMFTEFGQLVGTLEYMSPEQAKVNQLDVDTRSDIYSLGVLLYELLTGSTPFDKARLGSAGWDEMLRIIREEEPLKPSTKLSSSDALPSVAANRSMEPARLSRAIRGELDWIVMKALEKDRGRRYETANGLALDLQRYLCNEPVLACPPSAAYRVRKFAGRNKAALATGTVVIAALILGTVVSTWQAIRATNAESLAQTRLQAEEKARRDAEIARDGEAKQRRLADEQSRLARVNAQDANVQRQKAEANFDKARRAVDEYLTQVTESELLTVPGLQPLREDLLQAALKFYAEFTQERADDPTLVRELASAHHRLATIQRDLGNAEASQRANLEAIRLYEQLRDQGTVSVELQAGLASAYFFAGRHNDTVKLCQAVMQEAPEHAEVRSLLAETYNSLAVAEGNKKNNGRSLKYHQQAFDLREALVRDFPDDPRYLAQLGATVNNLGVLLGSQGKNAEALAMFERAVDYSSQAYERAPHSILWGRWLCTGLRNVATNQEAAERHEEALRSYERLVSVSRKRAFENPAIGTLRADLYQAYRELGNYQKRRGDAVEASRSLRLAREVLEQTPREKPDQLFELATLYAVLASPPSQSESPKPNEVDEDERKRNASLAMQTLERAVEAGYQNASVLGTNQDLAPLRNRDDFQALLATVQKLAEADRLAKADNKDAAKNLADRRQAADLLKGLASAQPTSLRHRATLAATLQSIAAIQTGLKQFDEAEKSLGEALQLREGLLQEQKKPQARIDLLSVRAAMGQLDWERSRSRDAHRLWQEILEECQQLVADHAQDAGLQAAVVSLERSIGNTYGDIGLWDETLQSVDRGLKMGQLFDAVGDCRSASVLAAQGRWAEHRQLCQLIAKKWGKQSPAQTVWATALNPQPPMEGKLLVELAERVIQSDLDSLWKFKAATAWYWAGEYERALELMLSARDKVGASKGSAFLYWYALAYHKLGQEQDAERYFDEAEAKYLKSAENFLRGSQKGAAQDAHNGAWWHLAEDQAARRLAWSELRGTADLQDPWQHLIVARGYRAIGEVERSEAELAAAATAAPSEPNVLIARAMLLEQWHERQPSTEADWAQAVELAGDNPLTLLRRGHWYAKHGEQQKANADFTKVASLAPHFARAPFTAKAAAGYQQACADHLGMPVELTSTIGMKLRLIPAGEFLMGTPPNVAEQVAQASGPSVMDHERKAIAEEPVPHPVILTQPFYLGQFEVTRAQFRDFVNATGYRTEVERNGLGGWAHFQQKWGRRPQHIWSSPGEWRPEEDEPASHLNRSDALAFCEWLSKREGRRYVLPTEAQWEFACRAGTTGATYATADETLADVAWTNEALGSYDVEQYRPQIVGRKRPNAFGLYDMLGNVWEFCSDWYAAGPRQVELRIDPIGTAGGDAAMIRGGAWYRVGSVFARSSGRAYRIQDENSDAGQGFRVALEIDQPSVFTRDRSLAKRDASVEAAWQQAVDSAGDDPRPWIQRGRWYTERGEHVKADADFTKAAALTPDELNKFIEAGWWASTTSEGLSPLLPRPMASHHAPAVESTAPVAPSIVPVTPNAQVVEFRHVPELKDAKTAYAMTYVYAPEAKAVMLLVGGRSADELRLNGRLVYQGKTYLSPYNAERIPVLLRPGRNTLGAQVSSLAQDQALIVRIGDNRLDRGLALAELGFWQEALELLKPELAQGQRLDPQVWLHYAKLLLLTEDVAAYREFCGQVLNWLGDHPIWAAKLNVCQVCTLMPPAPADVPRLVQLVDEGVAGSKNASWAVYVQATVYFRAGRHQEVLKLASTGGMGRTLLRAMCWHHLGEPNKAKSELVRAERELLDVVRMGPDGPSSAKASSSPHGLLDHVGSSLLLREARALISPDTSADDQALDALIAQTREQYQAADPRLLPFAAALIASGQKPKAWLERGRARAILGLSELADADFRKAAEIAPGDPEMLASRCLIYAELNRLDEALSDLSKLMEEEPDPAKAPARLAARQRLFDEMGEWPALFERSTQNRPADPVPWISRARYRLSHVAQNGAKDEDAAGQAIADLREAIGRGFRDFNQLNDDPLWQPLKARQDFQSLMREVDKRNEDELLLMARLEGHTELVRGLAFLPDGQRLVSVGRDKAVRIWDLKTRSVLSSFAVEGYFRDADVSADGRFVAVVSNEGPMKGLAHVWDLEKQERLGEFVQEFKWIEGIRFSPAGTHIVTSGNPARGVLWDLSTGKVQQRFALEDTAEGFPTAFSPDGRLLAYGTVGHVHLFEVASGARISTIELAKNRFIVNLAFSANGARLAIGQNGGNVSVIDVGSRLVMKTLHASDSAVCSVQFLTGERFVIAASFDGTVRIWDIERETVISTAASKAGSSNELAVSRDGRFAVTAGGESWDEASKKWAANGDYDLRLWRLPKSTWDKSSPPAAAEAVERPVSD